MGPGPYKVLVILDREFGNRLLDLPPGVPVWIIDTAPNRAAAERAWALRPDENHLTGVTTFKASKDCTPEETLLAEIDTIDLHHGSYSARHAYTVLEVFGTPLTVRLRAELANFGFQEFQNTSRGFSATRPAL
jgi:hypothetical protein